jgi:uncharacterized protein with NRDE domain
MCLILLAWRVHRDYPLVVAANRDEFFSRPTAAADFWSDADVLAGRDLRDNGTWMGVSRSGRFAALTNYRDPDRQREGRVSRGELVSAFLVANQQPAPWLAGRVVESDRYNGFNLIAAADGELAWASNITGECHVLGPGVYGLSNHLLDSPWPKLRAGRSALERALNALPDTRPLFELLRDDTVHPDDQLPRTGVSLEWERLLSSAFVRAPGYGTRSSTVLLVRRDGAQSFDEQTWDEDGNAAGRCCYRFRPSGFVSSRGGESRVP